MLDKIIMKKSFTIKDRDYQTVVDYLDNKIIPFEAKFYEFYEGEYTCKIGLIPELDSKVELVCGIFKESVTNPIYRHIFEINHPNELFKTFMLDTKNIRYNNISPTPEFDDDVEVYFSFELEKVFKNVPHYLRLKDAVEINHSLLTTIGLSNNLDFGENTELFVCLYSFINSFEEIYNKSLKPDTYFDYLMNKLDFIKEKFEYYGYNEDYILEHKEKVEKLIKENKNSMLNLTYNDIFKYFMVNVLDLLINSNINTLIDRTDILFAQYYCDLEDKDLLY